MKHVLLAAAVLAVIEALAVLGTDTWLSPTEWGLLWLWSFSVGVALLGAISLAKGALMEKASDGGRVLFLGAYLFGTLFVFFWMGGFYAMPYFGVSVLPAEEPEVAKRTTEFYVLTGGSLWLAFAAAFWAVKSPSARRWMEYAFPPVWLVMLLVVIYDAARTSFELVHLAGVVFLGVSVVRGLPSARRMGLTLLPGLLAVLSIGVMPDRLAHTVAERTRLFFHLPHQFSFLRELPELPDAQSCLRVEPGPSPEIQPVRGVLLVFVDALRADRIGMTYQGRELTPNLNTLAKESVNFESAYSVYPSTTGTATSMGSGQYLAKQGHELGDTLAAYSVAFEGIVAHPYVAKPLGPNFKTHPLGIDGFNHWFDVTSGHMTPRVLEHLEKLDGRFVFLAHYYDAHEYYVPNDFVDFGAGLEARYNAEVALVDHELGKLLEAVPEDVAVIVMSDHGDELGEHGFYHHQVRVYDGTARLVMMVRAPGLEPRTHTAPVSTVDIAPTIFALLGIEGPPMDGVSLLAAPDDRVVMVRGIERTAFVSNQTKAIWNFSSRTFEVYDRKTDPAEARNLGGLALPACR